MLFVNDVVLNGESRKKMNERLETRRQALEENGFRLSRRKTENMDFSKIRKSSTMEVKVGGHIISQVTHFKYLGFIIQNDEEKGTCVNNCIM